MRPPRRDDGLSVAAPWTQPLFPGFIAGWLVGGAVWTVVDFVL